MSVNRCLAALSLMFVAIVGIGCSGSDTELTSDGADSGTTQGRRAGVSTEEQAVADDGGGTAYDTTTSAGSGGGDSLEPRSRDAGLPDIGTAVIKTATVELEVADDEVQSAIQDATGTAEKYGGFVVSTTVAQDADHPEGSIVIRIPASRFGAALADLEGLGQVTSESVSGQDVSQEFIDLEARLRNYVTQETVMLRLMERAQSIVDTIRVQNELQRVQLEIERLRGRIGYLEDQTAMSTIELRVAEEGAIAEPPGEFEKAWERAKNGLVAVVAGVITSLGVIVPIAVLALIVVFVVARLRPRFTNAS